MDAISQGGGYTSHVNATRAAALCISLGFGSLIAVSCASGTDQVGSYSAFEPAPSQARAQARKEREARKRALADLSASVDAGTPPPPSRRPPPPKPPKPPPAPTSSASAAPSASVAAGDAGAPDAGPPGVDKDALCAKLCERVVVCAKEMMGSMPPGLGPSVMDNMISKIEKECSDECTSEIKDADAERVKKGQACLDAPDCDEFMKCMREVRGKDKDKDAKAPPGMP